MKTNTQTNNYSFVNKGIAIGGDEESWPKVTQPMSVRPSVKSQSVCLPTRP